jgi:hypothetical protein
MVEGDVDATIRAALASEMGKRKAAHQAGAGSVRTGGVSTSRSA